MSREESKQHLLPSHRDSYDGDDLNLSQPNNTKSLTSYFNRSIFTSVLILSLLLNFVLIVSYHHAKSQVHLCPSEYTGIGLTTKAKYWQSTDYTHPNRTISDAAWEAIDTSPNTVSLDKDYVKKHNLPDSIPFPWDQSKGLYIVKAFHHIHCLKNLRHAYNEALSSHPGQHQLIPAEHVYHCLDIFRQDVMCRPDDTPMPTIQERHKIGDGQERRCKDWGALVEWTQSPKREACFKMINDYRRMHTLEQFAFCREGSQYKSTMEDYFREHGHRNLYLDDDPEAKDTDAY